jgi:hypothetical protein
VEGPGEGPQVDEEEVEALQEVKGVKWEDVVDVGDVEWVHKCTDKNVI